MTRKSLAVVAGVGVWTSVTLAGGIFLVFRVVMAMGARMDFTEDPIPLFLLVLLAQLTITIASGGLWGLGIGYMMHSDVRHLTHTAALTWTMTAVIASMVLGLSQGPIFAFVRATPFDLHTLYTLEFVLGVGLVSALNASTIIGKLGFHTLRKNGAQHVGIAAAVGFLIADLILWFGFGWEVGRPVTGKYSMVTITILCATVAALAGGLTMGVTLVRGQRR